MGNLRAVRSRESRVSRNMDDGRVSGVLGRAGGYGDNVFEKPGESDLSRESSWVFQWL